MPTYDAPVSAAPARAPEPGGAPAATAPRRLPRLVRLSGLRGPSDVAWGWLGPLLVAGLGGALRFWRLGHPDTIVFDETYYVKQGYTMLREGYELDWPSEPPPGSTLTPDPDVTFAAGTLDFYLDTADFVVHPPVGKQMIAAGMWLFGGAEDPASWRFASAVVGTLSILLVARTARRLFGSTLLGVVAGLLLAVDGSHFVHSRTGLLDVFLMFWALAAFACLVADRDWARQRLARAGPSPGLGPVLGWWGVRPWRVAAGVCLGLAVGVKWSGLFFLAAFGLMTVAWDAGARRSAGQRHWATAAVLRDGVPAFLSMVPVALATYLLTWTGWFRAEDSWRRQWAAEHPSASPMPDALRSLWRYHQDTWRFHVGLASEHPYQAHPWSWLVQGRPTSFYYRSVEAGQGGCEAAEGCSRAITSLGTPVIWWAGTLAVAVLGFQWALRRDWRAGAVLAGLAAGYLPWFAYAERTVYTFYAVAFAPFLVLGLTYTLGLLLGPPQAPPDRRRWGAVAAGTVVVAAVLCFVWFLPVYTAQLLPYSQWRARMWLPSWI